MWAKQAGNSSFPQNNNRGLNLSSRYRVGSNLGVLKRISPTFSPCSNTAVLVLQDQSLPTVRHVNVLIALIYSTCLVRHDWISGVRPLVLFTLLFKKFHLRRPGLTKQLLRHRCECRRSTDTNQLQPCVFIKDKGCVAVRWSLVGASAQSWLKHAVTKQAAVASSRPRCLKVNTKGKRPAKKKRNGHVKRRPPE